MHMLYFCGQSAVLCRTSVFRWLVGHNTKSGLWLTPAARWFDVCTLLSNLCDFTDFPRIWHLPTFPRFRHFHTLTPKIIISQSPTLHTPTQKSALLKFFITRHSSLPPISKLILPYSRLFLDILPSFENSSPLVSHSALPPYHHIVLTIACLYREGWTAPYTGSR